VGEFTDLFATLDRKAKLYQRKEDHRGAQRAAVGRFLGVPNLKSLDPPAVPDKPLPSKKLSLRALTEQAILQQLDKVAALVNAQGDVLYLHGRAGLYLEPAQGEAGISNILKMAREGLRRDLTMALHKVASTKQRGYVGGLRVHAHGYTTQVDLTVSVVASGNATALDVPLFLVMLEQAPNLAEPAYAPAPDEAGVVPALSDQDANTQIAELQEALRTKEEYLHAANEELETTNEELKSSNEEMQSVNEELQSSNEELETSKEELQSINEELTTVNAELQAKVSDLSRANNDMNNLLAGTGIGTIFVDTKLCILRFTPAATLIVNLILSDVGRPMGHIVSNLLNYNSLLNDAQAVLDTLVPKALDVRTVEGLHYTMHMLPYRTLENVVEGVVITFVDISEIVRIREALAKANTLLQLAVIARDTPMGQV
jgi:two-component system CheB/CheR fusion protein